LNKKRASEGFYDELLRRSSHKNYYSGGRELEFKTFD